MVYLHRPAKAESIFNRSLLKAGPTLRADDSEIWRSTYLIFNFFQIPNYKFPNPNSKNVKYLIPDTADRKAVGLIAEVAADSTAVAGRQDI